MLHRITVCTRATLASKLIKNFNKAVLNIEEGEQLLEHILTKLKLNKKQTKTQLTYYLFGLVGYLEAYITDCLYQNLICFPGNLESKAIELNLFPIYGSALGIIKHSAKKQVNDFNYKSFKEIISYLSEKYNFKPRLSNDLIDQVNEIKCTRDIYTHNGGISNETYERKASSKARSQVGKELILDKRYIDQATLKVKELVSNIYNSISRTFKDYNKSKAFQEMWEFTIIGKNHKFDDLWKMDDNDIVRPKKYDWAWSRSEQVLLDFFLNIYNRNGTDIIYTLKRWPAETPEGQVVLSWLDNPFYF